MNHLAALQKSLSLAADTPVVWHWTPAGRRIVSGSLTIDLASSKGVIEHATVLLAQIRQSEVDDSEDYSGPIKIIELSKATIEELLDQIDQEEYQCRSGTR